MGECLFCQIVSGKIPAKMVYENEHLVVFSDIHPQAPVHYLIVPRQHISDIEAFQDRDFWLAGEIFQAVKYLKKQPDFPGDYRLVVNAGTGAGQSVPHLHVHFLSGRNFGWPPG